MLEKPKKVHSSHLHLHYTQATGTTTNVQKDRESETGKKRKQRNAGRQTDTQEGREKARQEKHNRFLRGRNHTCPHTNAPTNVNFILILSMCLSGDLRGIVRIILSNSE